eukprot:88294_1
MDGELEEKEVLLYSTSGAAQTLANRCFEEHIYALCSKGATMRRRLLKIGIGFTRGQAVRYGLRFFLNSTGIMSIPKPPLLNAFKHNIHIVYTIRDATITSASYYK